jgi:tetratricopeptide (TPR) repeat protein
MKSQFLPIPPPTLILAAEEETVRIPRPTAAREAIAIAETVRPYLAAEAAQWLKQGLAHFRQGQFTPALALLQQALQGYQRLADQPRSAKVLLILASIYYRLADYLWAADYGRQCLRLAHALQDLPLQQQVLEHLGNSYRHLGDLQQALEYMGQSLHLAKQMNDQPAEMRTLNNLAMVYRAKGLTRQAATLYEASLLMARSLKDVTVQLQILQNLGNTYQTLHHYPQAIECYESFLRLNQGQPSAVVDNYTTRRILTQLTAASLAIHDYNRAIIHLQRHLTIACTLGDTRSTTTLIDDLSHCYAALNQARAFREDHPSV